MQSVIKKFFVNDITTKYGQKKKYDIYIDTEGGEWKFSAWGGQWNQDWGQGKTVLLPEMGDQRWKVSQYNGNDQYLLSAPPTDGYAQPSNPAPLQPPQQAPVSPQMPAMNTSEPSIPVINIEETSSLELQIEEILKIVNEINKQLNVPASQALGIEKPANEDEVDLSNVKF